MDHRRALRLAATGMVAEIRETAGPLEGQPPSRALVSGRSATPGYMHNAKWAKPGGGGGGNGTH